MKRALIAAAAAAAVECGALAVLPLGAVDDVIGIIIAMVLWVGGTVLLAGLAAALVGTCPRWARFPAAWAASAAAIFFGAWAGLLVFGLVAGVLVSSIAGGAVATLIGGWKRGS